MYSTWNTITSKPATSELCPWNHCHYLSTQKWSDNCTVYVASITEERDENSYMHVVQPARPACFSWLWFAQLSAINTLAWVILQILTLSKLTCLSKKLWEAESSWLPSRLWAKTWWVAYVGGILRCALDMKTITKCRQHKRHFAQILGSTACIIHREVNCRMHSLVKKKKSKMVDKEMLNINKKQTKFIQYKKVSIKSNKKNKKNTFTQYFVYFY